MMKLFVLTLAFVFSMLVERGKGFGRITFASCWYRDVEYEDNGKSFHLPGKNPCLYYICTNNKITVRLARCQDNRSNCWAKDARWEDDCVFYKCAQISEEIYISQIMYKGCLNSNGECQDINSPWTDGNCTTYQCELENNVTVLRLVSPGCRDHNGHCQVISSRWTDNDCAMYQCQLENNVTVSRFVSQGCYHRNSCREFNSTWIVNCRNYECRNSRNLLRVLRTSGKCVDANGVCRSNGERFTYHNDTCTCTVHRRRKYATEIYCR